MISAENSVRDAYLTILGRQADPVGLAEYIRLLSNKEIDEAELRSLLISSNEYRSRYACHPQGRQWINDLVAYNTNRIVQTGPFSGMVLADLSSRGDGDLSPKLLGTYEQDIHPYIQDFCSRNYHAILDVGCAEGYYAVGLARLFTKTCVLAFDIDQEALEITRQSASQNGCLDQITTAGICDPETLRSAFNRFGRTLTVVDCEGYEKELFSDPDTIALSSMSDLIIECHDLWDRSITPNLVQSFSKTHKVSIVYAGARNPNIFPFLRHITDWDRWLAVWERREGLMNWLVCESRLGAG